MRRLTTVLAAACLFAAIVAPAAQASFGLRGFDVSLANEDGTTATQAGAHPFSFTTEFAISSSVEGGHFFAEGRIKDILLEQMPGLVADSTAYPRCSTVDFLTLQLSPERHEPIPSCPLPTQVGVTAASTDLLAWRASPVYNLVPPPGVLVRLGWNVAGEASIVVDVGLTAEPPYVGYAASRNTPQTVDVIGVKAQLWGVPSDPRHDPLRGECLRQKEPGAEGGGGTPLDDPADYQFASFGESESCPVPANPKPLLTTPTNCSGPLATSYETTSWEGAFDAGSVFTHELEGGPQAFTGCGKLPFHPSIEAKPTTRAAQSPSGLDFSLNVDDQGLVSAKEEEEEEVLSASDIEKTVVTLPKGMTVNPSQAEGLEVCTEAGLARETLGAQPGEGCPQASKIGTVEVESPLVSEPLDGSLFVAQPYHNLAGNSLLAVYLVIKNANFGIVVKQPLKVTPDPVTGQLTTVAKDIPQLPFSSFRLHFREGGRSPLVSPPGCGSFDVKALLYPWSGEDPVESRSPFTIVSGPDNSPCPAGQAPFHPGFEAGSENNAAGHYSSFDMRLTRKDGEQDISKLSFVLPAGVVPKLAGIPYCPESGIARAMSRTGEHGGTAELNNPSCPAASQIGRTVAGAGVGGQLTYVPGKLYLAGPYHGDPISAVSITPAVAGPFDAGAVVVREALRLNPVTHVGEVDGSASDPIPHILQGIPLNLRDLRVYADRPEFTLTPTSCEEEQAHATLWSAGTALEPLREAAAALGTRYQAADCAALAFHPKLGLRLKGATRRGGFPALHAVYTPRAGDANLKSLALAFPRSEFVEQGHFQTICTRVQFAAAPGFGAQCPAGSVYGHVRAWSPLLSEPLEGPVFLRSSNHNLPDAIFALHGLVDIEVAVRIDSVHGRLRASVLSSPDAPVSKAVVDMQGGQKGLFVNSASLCAKKHRAGANIEAHNGKLLTLHPLVRPRCGHSGRHHRR